MKKFTFGKYKGKTIEVVAEHDPSYIKWCNKNVRGFEYELEEQSWRNAGTIEQDTYSSLNRHQL